MKIFFLSVQIDYLEQSLTHDKCSVNVGVSFLEKLTSSYAGWDYLDADVTQECKRFIKE